MRTSSIKKIYKELKKMLGKIIKKPLENDEKYKEYAEMASWCNANNAVIVDYKDNYKIENIPETLIDELRKLKLKELNEKSSEYIYKKYSDYKQSNLAIFGSDAEKKKFKDYYDAMKEKYTKYRGKILYANTKEEIDKIEIEF
jgi:hypothetical protein